MESIVKTTPLEIKTEIITKYRFKIKALDSEFEKWEYRNSKESLQVAVNTYLPDWNVSNIEEVQVEKKVIL